MKEPEVIGEGTYGCVTKPSLVCKGSKRNYSHKVSKIMIKKYAKKEHNDMKQITKIDGIDKYIVSLPDLCVPKLDTTFIRALRKCGNEKIKAALEGDFRLLVIEDGGISLKQFTEEVIQTLSKHDICVFLTKTYNLLEALCFFYEHDIVHHDIKMRNIVYNIETTKIKFIDFGLMKKRSKLVRESTNNKNDMAQKWANFPPEYNVANKYHYDKSDYQMKYKDFIERLSYTFDAYGLGIMMKSLIEDVIRYNSLWDIDLNGLQELYYFFDKMGEQDIHTRTYDLYELRDEYKKLLQDYGIWLQDKAHPSAKSVSIQKNISAQIDVSPEERNTLKTVLQKYIGLNPCANGKERNPYTRRCVNKCKEGYTRNEKFKCRKTKKRA